MIGCAGEVYHADALVRPEDLEIALQRVHARSQLARENRYLQNLAGRDNMLVEFPIGERGTLGEALELLGKRKWRG